MATGFLSAGKCWETMAQATDAWFSSQPHFVVANPSNGFTYQYYYAKDGISWMLIREQQTGGVQVVSKAHSYPVVYGQCTYEAAGVEYNYEAAIAAWGFGFMTVVGLWLLAKHFGVILDFIRRA